MFSPYSAFKKPVILEKEFHKNVKVKPISNFEFMKTVETVPLGFSELLSASMYYPVLFGVWKGNIFPFAVMGINGKNVYLNEEGHFKVDYIPKSVMVYPFGVIKQVEESKEEFLVIVDEACFENEGNFIFDENGAETPYFLSVKEELTQLALDYQKALDFAKELFEIKALKLINFTVETKYGYAEFKNVLIGDLEGIKKIQPEKLYFFNAIGYLPCLYSIYFSARNFKLWDLI